MTPTPRDLMVARAVLRWVGVHAFERDGLIALLESIPEPAGVKGPDKLGGNSEPAEHERHCSLCEGQYIHDECDVLGLGPPEPAEHEQAAQDDDGTLVGLLRDAEDLINKAEQAAQDAEQPYPQDTGDWRFGPCVRCGDDPITWPQSDTTPIKCLTCQSYERGLAEGARAERERIEKLLRHYGSVVDLEK